MARRRNNNNETHTCAQATKMLKTKETLLAKRINGLAQDLYRAPIRGWGNSLQLKKTFANSVHELLLTIKK